MREAGSWTPALLRSSETAALANTQLQPHENRQLEPPGWDAPGSWPAHLCFKQLSFEFIC